MDPGEFANPWFFLFCLHEGHICGLGETSSLLWDGLQFSLQIILRDQNKWWIGGFQKLQKLLDTAPLYSDIRKVWALGLSKAIWLSHKQKDAYI